MGKTFKTYVGIITLYLYLLQKRALTGIISLIVANIIACFTDDLSKVNIIKGFSYATIISVWFVGYKNESRIFKILRIQDSMIRISKLGLIIPLLTIQWFIFLISGNDKG
jgi:hypothetical protein